MSENSQGYNQQPQWIRLYVKVSRIPVQCTLLCSLLSTIFRTASTCTHEMNHTKTELYPGRYQAELHKKRSILFRLVYNYNTVSSSDIWGGNCKELLHNKLRLTWGWAEIYAHCSYCSNHEQVGLTWVLLSVPIMCITSDGQRIEEELSSDQ